MFNVGAIFAQIKADNTDFVAKVKTAATTADSFAKQTGLSFNKAQVTSTALGQAIGARLQQGIATTDADIRKMLGNMSGLQQEIGKTTQGSNQLTKTMLAGLGFAAALKGLQLFKRELSNSIQAAAQFQSAMIGLSSVAVAFGQDAQSATVAAQELANDGLMSVKDSADGLKNLLASGFNLEESTRLMNAFKDSATNNRQGTLEFGEAIVGATQGIKNQNSIMVDNAGITKNLSNILVEAGYSQQDLSKAATDASVRQALYNGILKEAEAFQGDAAKAADTLEGKYSRLQTATFNLRNTIGQQLAPAYGVLLDAMIRNVNATNDSASANQGLSKQMYQAANIAVGMFETFKLGLNTFEIGILSIRNFARTIYAFVKDAAANFGAFQQALAHVASGMVKLVSGDFSGAFDSLSQKVRISMVNMTEATAQNSASMSKAMLKMNGNVASAQAAYARGFSGEGFKELELSSNRAGGAIDRTNNLLEEAKRGSREAKDELIDLAKRVGDGLGTLREQITDTWDKFKDKIKGAKEGFAELSEAFSNLQTDLSKSNKNLGKELASALLESESLIKDNRKRIKDIEKSTASDVLSIRKRLSDKIVDIEKDKNNKLNDLGKEREMLVAEKIALINNSINDYATAAELAEAEQKIADIQSGKVSDVAEIDRAIENAKREASQKIAAEKATSSAQIAERRKTSNEQKSILQKQISDEQKIINSHKQLFKQFSSSITEARRLAGQDQFAILKNQFKLEQKEMINNFAKEHDMRANNFEDVKNWLKQERQEFKKHVKKLKKRRENAIDAIAETAQGLINYLDQKSGGVASRITGGGDARADVRRIGEGKITIGDIIIKGDADVDNFISRLTNMMDATL